jgi:DNA-binding PadR family transcriptional regulator
MEDMLNIVHGGSESSSYPETELAGSFVEAGRSIAVADNIAAQITIQKNTSLPVMERRKRTSAPAMGITGKEYQVLKLINSYGWCTPEMVRRIVNLHGNRWANGTKRANQLLRSLEQSELIVSRKVSDGTRTRAYAVTDRGRRYILAEGDALLCDTNAIKDPASAYHFLGLNSIMLEFRSRLRARFWLSDFEVRSDNSYFGREGLAKDYDSVAELALSTDASVRFAIEFERSHQSSSRYEKLHSMLVTEKRLQCVLFFVSDPRLRNRLMSHLKSLVGFAYFIEYDRFLKMGMETPAFYWNKEAQYQAPLNAVLQAASKRPMQSYTPIHQLDLRVQR